MCITLMAVVWLSFISCPQVIPNVPISVTVSGVSLNKTSTSIAVGNTETLVATVSPSNALNKNVTWSSSNEDVATVSASGVVTAVSQGTANITVITVDGGYDDVCVVTVTQTELDTQR